MERKLTNTVFFFKSSAWLVVSLYGHVAFGPPLTQQSGTPGVSNILIKVVLRANGVNSTVRENIGSRLVNTSKQSWMAGGIKTEEPLFLTISGPTPSPGSTRILYVGIIRVR